MDLTQGTIEEKTKRAKRMMLWFAIGSIIMMFAGLTSAYIVSRTRPDWSTDFDLPSSFLISTIVIMLSSISIHFAKRAIKKVRYGEGMLLLVATFILGIAFIYFQYQGLFIEVIAEGYNPTGPTSTVALSLIYVIAAAHVVHIIAALIVLTVVIYNHYKKKYIPGKTLGLELSVTFWHFLDALWIYLILFFYFFR